jgi:hypothetical protein
MEKQCKFCGAKFDFETDLSNHYGCGSLEGRSSGSWIKGVQCSALQIEQSDKRVEELTAELQAVRSAVPDGYLTQTGENLSASVALMAEGLQVFIKEINELRQEVEEARNGRVFMGGGVP